MRFPQGQGAQQLPILAGRSFHDPLEYPVKVPQIGESHAGGQLLKAQAIEADFSAPGAAIVFFGCSE